MERQVVFDAPAGVHELLITDMPLAIDPSLLRVTSAHGDLGAFLIRTDRLPPRGEATLPEIVAARLAVTAAEQALRGAEGMVALINADVEAQEAQITLLTGIKLGDAGATAEAMFAVSQMIGAEVLTARMAALAAQGGMAAAEDGVREAEEALTAAQDALAAVSQRDEDYVALSVAVTAKGGPDRITVTHYVYEASLAPVYDMALDREAGRLVVARGILVSQNSGENWAGVDLTLSTARPAEQSEPAELSPWLRRIADPPLRTARPRRRAARRKR